jgi:ATP-dependent helicase/nuclease subunit A
MAPSHDASNPALNVSVIASAGTGKTWLLVTRIVRLLLEGARPDAILAITFTRKAAGEMQQRLSERLLELAVCDDATLIERLTQMGIELLPPVRDRARRLYESILASERQVHATTFHAFCQEILRRFPLDADVAPGFELLERTGGLQLDALEALFAEATVEPDGAVALALEELFDHCGGLHNTQEALREFLEHRSDWWAFTEETPDPVTDARDRLLQGLCIDPNADPLALFSDPDVRAELQAFAELLYLGAGKTEQEQARHLEGALHERDMEQCLAVMREVFFNQKNEPRVRKVSRARAAALGERGVQRFLELQERFCERIGAALEYRAQLATYRSTAAWYLAGQRLLDHYQRIKAERRLLDFADLEWKAYQLLTRHGNAHWVQYKLDARIDHILVDEFQDTNPTQWRLLLPLLEELAAGGERKRSVFFVGDPKQSIYRFRRADSRLLTRASRWAAENLAAQTFPLHESRRSASAIIELVNRVFDGPLGQRLLNFQPHATFEADLWGQVELLPLVPPLARRPGTAPGLRNPLLQPRWVEEDQRHYREGELIAQRIRALLAGPTLIRADGRVRPLTCNDILILLRTRVHARAYEAALRGAGLPYLGADRGTLLESQEVQDLEALLKVLVTPYNNLALAMVLRSPLFAASDEDLMRLAASPLEGHWRERLAALAPGEPEGSPLRRAHRWLTQWQALAGRLPVHDLLDRIYSQGNVLARFSAAFPAHLRSRVSANLIRFIELALEIDSGRYPSIPQFLSRLRGLRQHSQDAPDEAPAPAAEPRVRLLTIHAAKGLEAPVVFLADATHTMRPYQAYQALIDWPPEAERPQSLVLSGRKDALDALSRQLLQAQARAEQREDANLLYVALTRAKQYLFISGCVPNRVPSRVPAGAGRALGWYGEIAACCGLDPNTLVESMVVSRCGKPPSDPVLPARPLSPPSPVEAPDPRLRCPPAHASAADIALDADDAEAGVEQPTRYRARVLRRALHLLTTHPTTPPPEILQRLIRELGPASAGDSLTPWWQEACRVVQAPALRELFDPLDGQTVYHDVPLHYRTEAGTVRGVVDRLIVRDREVLLIVYETDARAREDNLEEFATRHRERLQRCAQGAMSLWPGRTVRMMVVLTACQRMLELPMEGLP